MSLSDLYGTDDDGDDNSECRERDVDCWEVDHDDGHDVDDKCDDVGK